jgi:hypothetical protein
MKIIITEDQYHHLRVRRRLDQLWDLIKMTYPYMYPCDYERDGYLSGIAHEIGDVISDTEYMDDNTTPMAKEMVSSYFANRLLRHWMENCGDK